MISERVLIYLIEHALYLYNYFSKNKKLSNDKISSFESLCCGDPYGN